MWFRGTVAYFCILTLCLSCKGTIDTNPSEKNSNAMEFETLLSDQFCNFEEQTLLKITNQKELVDVFSKINSTRKPGIPVPEIDFERFDLAMYTPGTLSTGGHTLKAIEVIKHHDKVFILMGGTSPGPGEMATTVITSPCVLLQFEKTDLPLKLGNLQMK